MTNKVFESALKDNQLFPYKKKKNVISSVTNFSLYFV